jgi:hypothetical protein
MKLRWATHRGRNKMRNEYSTLMQKFLGKFLLGRSRKWENNRLFGNKL